MKIIPPTFEILPEADQQDPVAVLRQIESRGRICYKSEHKITSSSYTAFTDKIAKNGHNSVLEMAVFNLIVTCSKRYITELLATQPRYLQIDRLNSKSFVVSGSVRAFRELEPSTISTSIHTFLHALYPELFQKQAISKAIIIAFDNSPTLNNHRYTAVKFVVNRVVSHEIVRHRPCSLLQESQRYCRYNSDVTFIKPVFFKEDSTEYLLWKKAMLKSEHLYQKLLQTASPQAARTVLPNSCKTEIIVYANMTEWKHIFSLRTSKAADPSMREVMVPLEEKLCGK